MANSQIPYGVQDYKQLVKGNRVYVDKTPFIEKLEYVGNYNVFLRPRRFGKSLMMSVLYYYYDILSKDEFENLFGNTYIGRNKTDEANSYHVLRMSFDGINTRSDDVESSFNIAVKNFLFGFAGYYNLDITFNFEREERAADLLRHFFEYYRNKSKIPIFVLIDEYDTFANEVLATDKGYFENMTAAGGFLRSFYEVLKSYSGSVIERIFVTGVTPITLDCFTSGFNLAKNISNVSSLNEMVGFTTDEVEALLDSFGIARGEHINTMAKYYNGYKFSENAENTLFNSNMVMYYLEYLLLSGRVAKDLTDTNFSSDLGKITGLFDIYEDEADKKEILESIVAREPVIDMIKTKFERDIVTSKSDFVSLLYYLGFLTISGNSFGDTVFTTPNYTVENTYFKYYLTYLERENNIRIDASEIRAFIKDLMLGCKYEKMKTFLEKQLKALSNRDYLEFDEKNLKLLLFASLRLNENYTVKSELEVDEGYIDLALLPNFIDRLDNYYIIELKYIKKADAADNEKFEKKRQEAIDQLNRYMSSPELSKVPNIRKIAIIAIKDKVHVEEVE